jgi:hypothetical protein
MDASAAGCPSAEELRELLGEELADGDRTAVEAHVETCAACQGQLERLVAPAAPPSGLPAPPRFSEPPAGSGGAFFERLRNFPVPPPGSGPTAGDVADALVPSRLGPYEILGRLGEGGMGTVYRARHRELDRVVALKVLPADRVDEAAVARFRNEMKAAGRLDHPNIVAARDAGRVGNTYYLAMDLVDGADLSSVVGRLGPLPVADACELVRQAAVGLQHACECGLVHRDVKPSNLMLARGGVVRVLDLGLARSTADLPAGERLTMSGALLGTADYIAPEQIDQAHAADARADVYGLGGTLYFLLTGTAPYGDRRTWWDKLRAHAEAAVPAVRDRRPDVPAGLADLLRRMLAKDPAGRPATPNEVAAALAPFAERGDLSGLFARLDAPPPGPRPAPPDTHPAGGRRHGLRRAASRHGPAAAAGALVALLAVAPFLVVGRGQPSESPGGGGGAPEPRAGAADEPDKVEGVRLTYGPYGPPRPDHHVLPGDQIDMAFVVRGAGKNREGEADLALAGEVVDETGKKVRDLPATAVKVPLDRGGSTATGTASFVLGHDQVPGDFRVRGRLADTVTGRVTGFEQPLVVRPKEFGATRLRLTLDQEGNWPAGCYLTVGHHYFLHMLVANFGHREKRIRVSVKVSAPDRNGKDTITSEINPVDVDQANVEDGFSYFDLHLGPLSTIHSGEVAIVVDLEDKIGQKKAKYELPAVIHPPRSLPLRAFTKER